MKVTRRLLLQQLSLATATLAAGAPSRGVSTGHASDWSWLVGNWDVYHERLRDRLVGSTTWDTFAGKSNCWLTLGGLGTIDDNLLELPAGAYRAFGVRAFDPATSQWAIWWLDGRTASRLDPPVRGRFAGSEGEFTGADVYRGTPVTVRFRWHDTNGRRPWWDQAFSTDSGKSWEINWRNYFTRTSAAATPLPFDDEPPAAASDWAFLVGRWRVRNSRRRADGSWEEFASTLTNWPVMGGLGNVGDNVFHAPGGTYRGMSLRAFDTQSGRWNSWWIDGRLPADIGAAATGGFEGGVGTLIAEDVQGNERVRTRSLWSRVTATSARWEQATSRDGNRWDPNWIAELEREH